MSVSPYESASWLRMAGEDIHTVVQLLEHKDLGVGARYQHLSPTLTTAVNRLDDVFGHQSVIIEDLIEADNSVTHDCELAD